MIHVKNLCKDFKIYKKDSGLIGAVKGMFSRKYDIKTAVNNISFDIGEGEMIGYIGSNGAGKSTAIKIMTGILVPTSGTCIVNGLVPYNNRQKNAKNIGVVFGQRTQLWWDLALEETFRILKEIYEISNDDYKERLDFLSEVLDLNEFMHRPVRTLSLGQKMRGDLAASLLHNPKILFLDEPTIGLDIVVKEKVLNAIKLMNKRYNTTVILTTHDLSDIEELCERIILIDSGKKVYDGSINNIKENYGFMRTVEISVLNINSINKLDFNKKFQLNSDELKSFVEGNTLSVTFNRNKISVSSIISYIISEVEVIDFAIKETEISEIVKKIYAHEVCI